MQNPWVIISVSTGLMTDYQASRGVQVVQVDYDAIKEEQGQERADRIKYYLEELAKLPNSQAKTDTIREIKSFIQNSEPETISVEI